MTSNYQYQIQQLPPRNVIGDNFYRSAQIGNAQVSGGFQLPTSGPSSTTIGGGGVPPGTVDLELCPGEIVRVYGYLL